MDFMRHREALPSPVRYLYCPFCGTKYENSDGECRVCRSTRGVSPYTGSNPHVRKELEGVSGPVWRKVLWERQPFPDNHTDASFLSCLSVNRTPRSYDWRILMRESTVVVQHASLIVILAVVFFRVQDGTIPASSLKAAFASCIFISCSVTSILLSLFPLPQTPSQPCVPPCPLPATTPPAPAAQPTLLPSRLLAHVLHLLPSGERMKFLCILSCALYVASPILETSTVNVSNNTAIALSVLATVIHALFHDYSYVLGSEGTSDCNRSALALNSGLFCAVIVASRLPTLETSMTYLVCGICAIAFAPDFFRAVYARSSHRAHCSSYTDLM
jgi:phosphatidylinositol N-acetylglucosaminyltransferase subunit C